MTPIDGTAACLLLGFIGGATFSGVAIAAAVTLRSRRRLGPAGAAGFSYEPTVESDHAAAAAQWARQMGRPGAAGLVAEKMRLAEELQRPRRDGRRW